MARLRLYLCCPHFRGEGVPQRQQDGPRPLRILGQKTPWGLHKAHPTLGATESAHKNEFIHCPNTALATTPGSVSTVPQGGAAERGCLAWVTVRSVLGGSLLHYHWLRQCLVLKPLNQPLHVDLEQRSRVLREGDRVRISCSGEGPNPVGQTPRGIWHKKTGPLRLGYSHRSRGQ